MNEVEPALRLLNEWQNLKIDVILQLHSLAITILKVDSFE